MQLLYLCLKFACAVLLLNQFSNSLHTHASLRIICIMGVDCLAVDPLLPAEVLCTSALTLIIGTYGPRQEEHPPVLAFKSAGRSDFPTKPASFMKDHRCRASRRSSRPRPPMRASRPSSRPQPSLRALCRPRNAGSSPSATPAAAAQGRGHRGPHNPLSALSAPGCAFPANRSLDRKQKRPPNVPGANVPHDSTIARPGIPHTPSSELTA